MLTISHFRFATNRQLATLFDTDENTVSRWTNQRHSISGSLLDRAACKGIDRTVILLGLDARRQDAELSKTCQEEFENFLSTLESVA